MNRCIALVILGATCGAAAAAAAPVVYNVDPEHTHPSFEVDHFAGLSVWRGNFKKTTGTVTVDMAAGTGTVEITIDLASIDFAHDKLNEHVMGADILDVAKYPTASYSGTLGFSNGLPTTVTGNLTLHGVTKPVTLTIDSFKCIQHPVLKKEVCGANATGTFSRYDFGVTYAQQLGFKPFVVLHIQVEARKAE